VQFRYRIWDGRISNIHVQVKIKAKLAEIWPDIQKESLERLEDVELFGAKEGQFTARLPLKSE
jgi:hypothetical protein